MHDGGFQVLLWVAAFLVKCSGQDRGQTSLLADNGWFPGQVRLASFGRDNYNSAMVADGWVITAASVFRNNYDPLMWSAIMVAKGAFSQGGQTTIHVQNIFMHGGYHENSDKNDIALVKLQGGESFMPDLNMQAQARYSPVDLPVPDQINEDTTCYLISWNNTKIGSPIPQDLRTTPVTLVNTTRCNAMYGMDSHVSPGQFCLASGNLEDGPCQGDQGSPVLCPYGKSWTVVGIVSNLFGCGAVARETTAIGTFTDVSHYLPWIYKIMSKF